MAQAPRDQNFVPALLGVSNVDGTTPVAVYADPTTHRLLVDLSSGNGTVTDVSVVSANGFAGTVATSTTTPAITLSTTVTGLIKGNGTAMSAAVANTDYVPAVMTVAGDIMYGGVAGVATRLGIGSTNTLLHGGASAPSYSAVVEADISLSNNTTNDVSTLKHGFMSQLPGGTTTFYRADGTFATPSSVTVPNAYLLTAFSGQTSVTVTHNFGSYPLVQILDNTGAVLIPLTITHASVNAFTVTFSISTTGNIISTLGSPQNQNFTSTAVDYTVLSTDYFVLVTASGKTITLPTAVGLTGHTFLIKNGSGGTLTVDTTSSQTIDLQLTQVVNGLSAMSVFSDGSNYWIN